MLRFASLIREDSDKQAFSTEIADGGIRQGLVFATLLNQGGGTRVESLVDRVPGNFTGTTKPVWSGSVYDSTSASSNAGIDYGSTMPSTVNLGQSPFTFFARVNPASSFSNAGGLGRRNDGNTVNAGWEIGCASGGTILVIERASVNFNAKTATALTSLKWQNVCIVYFGDLNATNVIIYYDGVAQAHSVSANGSGAQGSDAAQSLIIGQNNFTQQSIVNGAFNGRIDTIYMWNRVLRAEEVLALQVDPYLPAREGTNLIYYKGAAVASTFPALALAP